jgi:glycosyltransferase involved in cell wall biosynthesis
LGLAASIQAARPVRQRKLPIGLIAAGDCSRRAGTGFPAPQSVAEQRRESLCRLHRIVIGIHRCHSHIRRTLGYRVGIFLFMLPITGRLPARPRKSMTANVLEHDGMATATATGSRPDAGAPLVSIGMPVFNGENFVHKAIDSVLAQSFTDFELIICDNASDDATGEICRRYAVRDRRVRYVRNPRNIGAGPNFDHCFHLARGTYFQWAAHDDMLAPDYVARAVAALEQHPAAVLCTTGIIEIDADDVVIRRFATDLADMTAHDPARRFASVIHSHHQCEDFFGVYRRAALRGSGLIGTFSGSDRVLLAEMALRGPWVRLPDALFLHRDHAQRATRALLLVDREAARRWQAPEARPRQNRLFHLVLYRDYWRVVRRNLPAGQRWRCYRELARWWFTDGHFADVVRDLLQSIDPHLLRLARRLKRATFGERQDLRSGSLPTLER